MNSRRRGAVLASITIAVAATSALVPQQSSLELFGQYLCGTLVARITFSLNAKGDNLSGTAIMDGRVTSRRGNPTSTIGVRGVRVAGGRGFEVRTTDRIRLLSDGPERNVTLSATLVADSLYEGTTDYPGCTVYFVGRPDAFQRQSLRAERRVAAIRNAAISREIEAKRAAQRADRIRSGWIPPEVAGGIIRYEDGMMDYHDAWELDSTTNPEILPVESVSQQLRQQGHRCLSSRMLVWTGDSAVHSELNHAGGAGSYVISCRGNCKGVRYEVSASAALRHAGNTMAAPLISGRFVTFGNHRVSFRFVDTNDAQPKPQLKLDYWSPGNFTYGSGCTF